MEVTKERLEGIKLLITSWLDRERASLKDIQQLLGKLNCVGACVRSSRIFVNRILNWLRESYADTGNCFMIPIEVRKDLKWWHTFLPLFQGRALIDYRDWLQLDSVFSSDSCLTGYGGICGNNFFIVPFHGLF